jgi:hypothetical protein
MLKEADIHELIEDHATNSFILLMIFFIKNIYTIVP